MDEAALTDFGPHSDVAYDPTLVDDRPRLLSQLAEADGLIVRNRTQVDAELLAASPNLKVVGRLGVGLDNIDMAACEARGVVVRPATGANARSVAEYVISAALTLTRNVTRGSDAVAAGDWPRQSMIGGEVAGRVMGLCGFGTIAREVAHRARALGMIVAAHDPNVPIEDPIWAGVARCDREELAAHADIISLHVPLTDETRNMVNADAIARMKPGAILINTARGGIVDELALVAALRSGALGGAALDVFATEPLTAAAAAPFRDVPNLILTPHIAGLTAESDKRVSAITVANVKEELARATA
jgi:(S)-sulfolactate dehydrogenase